MIASFTLVYKIPFSSATSYANQVTEASSVKVPLLIAPYVAKIPLVFVSDNTAAGVGLDAGKIVRTLVYTRILVSSPSQPAFNDLFQGGDPTFAQGATVVKNLWTNVLAEALCTTVEETVTVA